jgi:hypothetical protein
MAKDNSAVPLPKPKPQDPEAWQGDLFPKGTDVSKEYEDAVRENRIRIYEHLKNRNLRPEAIAAIMGNIEVETGGSFSSAQRQTRTGDPREKGAVPKGGYGIFQFDDFKEGQGHKSWYNEYLEDTGKDDTVESQLDYVLDSIYADKDSPAYKFTKRMGAGDAGVLKQYLETTEDPKLISDAFLDRFEKAGIPHSSRRRDAATKYLQEINEGNLDRGWFSRTFGYYKEGGMATQMEMFQDGGLMDEGGTVDPVSGNEVPTGSLQEEVRDDIPAQLSEGEFVFPADVVRYYGLSTLMKMRQKAKKGLQVMDDMGQMGNSEEAILPDDIPFDIDDLELDDNDDSMNFAVGGLSLQPQGFVGLGTQQVQSALPTQTTVPVAQPAVAYTPIMPQQVATPVLPTSPTPTYSELITTPEGRYTDLRVYVNEQGQEMTIPFVNNQPVYPIPSGYSPKSEQPQAEVTTTQPTVPAPTVTATQDRGGDRGAETPTATAVFGGTSANGLITGGTTYSISYDSSEGGVMPGIIGALTGGMDRVTLTDPSGRQATMSRDTYNTFKDNRTSSETVNAINQLFDYTEAADQAISNSPALDTGFLGTGIGGNKKQLELEAAKAIYDDLGMTYSNQPLAEALMVQAAAERKAEPATPTEVSTTQQQVARPTTTALAPPQVGPPLAEVPSIDVMEPARGAPIPESSLSPLQEEVNRYSIQRGTRMVTYEQVGDEFYQVKDDGTLAKEPTAPFNVTLRNALNPNRGTKTTIMRDITGLPTRGTYRPGATVADFMTNNRPEIISRTTGEPIRRATAEDVRTMNRLQGGLQDYGLKVGDVMTPAEVSMVKEDFRTKEAQRMRVPFEARTTVDRDARLATDIEAAKGTREATAAIQRAEKAEADRIQREEATQRGQQMREERQSLASQGKGNIVTDSKGRPVVDSKGQAVLTSSGAKAIQEGKRAEIERQADAMRSEVARSELSAAQAKEGYATPGGTGKGRRDFEGAGGGGGGGKIVCTEMYRQTQLDDWSRAIKVWDIYQRKYLTPYHEKGYHWLFKPYVSGMKKSNLLTKLGAYLAKKRTQHLKHVLTKGKAKDSIVGNIWCKIIH